MTKRIVIGLVAFSFSILTFAQNKPTHKPDPILIVRDGKYGFIDRTGAIVIPTKFRWAGVFSEGYAPAYVCSKVVWIDSSGRILSSHPRDPNRLEPAKVNGKFGFVDNTGQFRIGPLYDEVLPFSDGAAAVTVGGLAGFIDTNGHQIIPPKFLNAFYFREGVATAETADGYVLIDKTGAILASDFQFTVGIVSEGRVPVSRDGKYGFLDLTGKIIIRLDFDSEDSFHNGLAPVEKGHKWGYIDRNGQTSIPFIFDQAGQFGNGLAPAKRGKESGFIDISGKFVFHLDFDTAPGFAGGLEDGETVPDEDVSPFWTSDNKFGYVTTAGKVIWGPSDGMPDHPPLLGWDEDDKIESCKGFTESERDTVAAYQPD